MLSQDATRIVDVGRALALRLGHAELAPEHVLLAATEAATDAAVFEYLLGCGVDRRRLRSALRARLDARLGIRGYRDATLAVSSASAFEALVAAAARRRRVLFFGLRVRAVDLVAAALAMPPFAAVVQASKVDIAPIAQLVDAARAVARAQRHDGVWVAHAVVALFDINERFRAAFVALEEDPGAVRRRIYADTARYSPSDPLAPLPTLVRFAASSTWTTDADEDGLAPLVVELLRLPSVHEALETAGVDCYEVLFAFAHGRPPPATFGPLAGDAEVVFHNDAHTTQQFVLAVLADEFGLSDAEARPLMLAVHERGRAVVARLPHDRAMAAVIRARDAARDHLMPLWIEVVAAPDG